MDDNVGSCNQTNGGPRGDLIRSSVRKGQIDWVPAISRASDFKQWEYKFRTGARVYLSKDVYTNEEERHFGWIIAMTRAPTLGNFPQMCDLIELFDHEGLRCEQILDKLKDRFLPLLDVERKAATSAFLGYTRGGKSLSIAVKELQDCILACHKTGYKPDAETVVNRYESLLKAQEAPLYRLYVLNDTSDSRSESDKCIRALEMLAKEQESIKPQPNAETNFAGVAHAGNNRGQRQRNGPRRAGYGNPPAQNNTSQECGRCGKGNCPTVRGEPKEKCFAQGKECKACGKMNHFERKCRKPKREAPQQAKTAACAQSNPSATNTASTCGCKCACAVYSGF